MSICKSCKYYGDKRKQYKNYNSKKDYCKRNIILADGIFPKFTGIHISTKSYCCNKNWNSWCPEYSELFKVKIDRMIKKFFRIRR